jgi:putative Mn2+ efflux pump MntP
MCVFTNYFAVFLSATVLKKTACLGGLVLIAIGVFNLVKKDSVTDGCKRGKRFLSQSLITGVVLGLDGAFANLSLSLMGNNAIYVPLTIAVMHALMIALGFALSNFPPFSRVLNLNFIPPVILIALGVIKLLGLFI